MENHMVTFYFNSIYLLTVGKENKISKICIDLFELKILH